MNIIDNLKMAIFSIRSNKMRSFLTMLGIIIGISSVIMILGVGGGAKAYMMGSMEQLGNSTVTISVNSKNATDSDYLSLDDIEAIKQKVDHVKYISPQWNVFGSVSFKTKENDAMIYGGSNDFIYLAQTDMVSGRFFSEEDYLSARNVVVIDEMAAMKFFGNTNIAGMTIDVNLFGERAKLKIVGVAKSQTGGFYMDGMPFFLYMPVTTMMNIGSMEESLSSVYVMADDPAFTESMGNSARNVLEARHSNRGRDVYQVQSLMGQVDMINNMLNIITGFISAVAAISLLVGGIGVMNIMLVAVTERTREIGIRKSLGAKTGSIMFQFLTESAILSLIGGAIGLILGILGAHGISSIVSGLAGGKIVPAITMGHITLALGFSCSVGLFFGIYPAKKAAKLNPIDALRHE
ncbi:ABC transporter permease [Hydrogenoanaerobacterium sp.]|uniref:ABC transporter permease n=1 Tax=Hydrogenoanaerobacterium sp. TaxID=2953763 RepID=UPI00289A899B|nr:ABC transporter permease [Hydrogenoanaerobacterium sp.]